MKTTRRLGMKFEIQSYIYFCKSVNRLADFYTQVLGLKVGTSRYTKDEWVELEGEGFKLCLHSASKAGSPAGNRNKLVFKVGNVATGRDYLLEQGVKMGKVMQMRHADACDGRDPEGNKFQITGPSSK
jgi:extradiol dioxygenase family protein